MSLVKLVREQGQVTFKKNKMSALGINFIQLSFDHP